jgi:S1-C subfamily serine protease
MRPGQPVADVQQTRRNSLLLLIVSSTALTLAPGAAGRQQAGGVQAAGPKVRMVRSVAGTKGETRGGSYVILDPRTTFYVPDDRQVIVYFEWEASKGTHHCAGTVKGPNGQLAVMSSFDYPATQTKFGGFWIIPLLENSSAGVWTFESRVDGEFAGDLQFEIVSAKRPPDATKEAVLPTPAEIYARAVAASVLIEKLGDKGEPVGVGSGFFTADGSLVTAFHVIDGAHTLRVQLADGTRVQLDTVAAWNRRQDWVVLKVDTGKNARLPVAGSQSWSIGDHCYWLDTKADGGRVIADGQIVGKESREGRGERISLSNAFNTAATGGPLLNERGEVLALLGGTLPESLVPRVLTDAQMDSGGGASYAITGSAIPLSMVVASSNVSATTLQSLWANGQFTPLVAASRNVSFGMISQGKPSKGKAPFSKEMKLDFTRQDDSATVLVSLQSTETLKTTTELRMYDLDNHLISKGEPIKITLRRGEPLERYWSFPLSILQPGVYRADVLLGDAVAWRTYFRLRE